MENDIITTINAENQGLKIRETDENKNLQEEKIKLQIENLKSQLPKRERKPYKLPVSISAEEFLKLISKTKKKYHKVAFLLGFGSGLRISEVLHLQASEINLKDRSILIKQGKGKKDRVVPLPKTFREEFLKYLPIKCGERALQKAFKRASKNAGLLENKPTLHFHSLRHGFATHAIKNNIPIHHIRTALGHANISTTNIYLEANPKDALKSFEQLF